METGQTAYVLVLCCLNLSNAAAAAAAIDADDNNVLLVCSIDQPKHHAAEDVPRYTAVSLGSQPWSGLVS